MSQRRICVVVASRANYGRVKSVMQALQTHPELQLQIVVGASMLLYRFGKAIDVLERDGFVADRRIHYVVEGETLSTQAKSTGLGIVELSTAFEDLRPDAVVTVADRFETMATAVAASYLNIPLVHIQGGEISGNIDDRVRHAVTKLADYHFPATAASRERILQMGEDPARVFHFGCPSIDLLRQADLAASNDKLARYGGVGSPLDWTEPYILMLQHPVTTSYGQGLLQVQETLAALSETKIDQKIVLWPNVDAGTDDVAKGIRLFRESGRDRGFHYFRNFSPEDYARVLNNAACAVGNSSSFIREGSYLGVPAVLVGDRQQGREVGRNVQLVEHDRRAIHAAILRQLAHGRYTADELFGKGEAGRQIVGQLAELALTLKQ